jgi:hypothetical protein
MIAKPREYQVLPCRILVATKMDRLCKVYIYLTGKVDLVICWSIRGASGLGSNLLR